MKRCNLICLFLGAGLTWAGAGEANHIGPITSPEDAREEIYSRIMTGATIDKLGRRDWSKPGGKRVSSGYSSAEEIKTLAVCINWNGSSHEVIDYSSWWYSYNYLSTSESKSNAIINCKLSYEKEYGCTCEAVDQDNKNILVVPEEFLARYAPHIVAGYTPGTTPKGNRFDGEWEGPMLCGDCEICVGPIKRNIKINIERGRFEVVPDALYMGIGTVDDKGNVGVKWAPSTHGGWGKRSKKNFWFDGAYDGEFFQLKGERGTRKCTIELSRVSSPVEASK